MCPSCTQDYLLHFRQGTIQPDPPRRLFLKRVIAKSIDFHIVVMVFFTGISIFDMLGIDNQWVLLFLGYLVAAYIAYGTVLTARYGGTLGKLACGLHVTRTTGEPLHYRHAMIRAMAEGISLTCFGIGFFMALADPHRRTLHDRIGQTRVLPRESVAS